VPKVRNPPRRDRWTACQP